MKLLILLSVVALTAASVVKDGSYGSTVIGPESTVNLDVKVKELYIMKLLNQILQPTVYEDIREVAKEWSLEENADKYLKSDVVKQFLATYKLGMLPVGEVFVHSDQIQLEQAVKVFKILYFAKDFDVFLRTCCWLRERINGGMFVYALTAAVFHRPDCKGIILPAPYEIYPYFFVDSYIIDKAIMMKMTKAATDPLIKDYYGITVTDNNLVVIDWRKGLRYALSEEDRLSYFTEDIDLNTFMYYLHMSYPFWMTDDVYNLNKERRGEVLAYANLQLLARLRLERLSQNMCNINPMVFDEPLETGYWPKIRLPTGVEMPVRGNNMILATEYNAKLNTQLDVVESMLRTAIITGKIETQDGLVITLKKPEDAESLAKLLLGGTGLYGDDAKTFHLMNLLRKMLGYSLYNVDKYTYVPTALDMYSTCLRDPVFWRLMKRVTNIFVMFKDMLPAYTTEELYFPGVTVDKISTDKLVTYLDDYDLDITNAVYLDAAEVKKKTSEFTFVARTRRMNTQPFTVTVDVTSDKTVESVIRIFIGPKYDCLGRLLNVNDKRLDMLEIDSFIYKLETGKNTIVRNSIEMQGVIEERPWTRNIFQQTTGNTGSVYKNFDVQSYWYKTRVGFPHRLLLPLGLTNGLPLQMYVIVTPVKTGLVLPSVDLSVMKQNKMCRWSVCFDTMPLGFPFDRPLELTNFYTPNMKFQDIIVYRKDMDLANISKGADLTNMVMKQDDFTYLYQDKLVKPAYKSVMMSLGSTIPM